MDSEVLIAAVYNKPSIWNRKDKYHSNRNVVEKCWKDISADMEEDETKLRKKWKYLRDQFAVELGKIPSSRSGEAGNTYTSKWPYFNLLLFLKDVVRPRQASGNVSKVAPSSHDAALSLDDSQFTTVTSPPTSPREEADENEDSLPPPACEESPVQARTKRLRPTNIYNEALLEIERQKLHYFKEKSKHKRQRERENEDEHLHFFKSLLPHVRKIPPTKLLSFRNRIQEVVEQYAYEQHFSSASTPQSSLSTLTVVSQESLQPISELSLVAFDSRDQSI
ncbi:uncharacterized protein [Anabrus simplex]|uniref:uncharacterized protein n=1 Tax=Anabrus simplex TaxID=316456 RepID=UPI0035A2B3E9